MKVRWGIMASFVAIMLAVVVGCDHDGGGSGDSDGGSTNKPVILKVRFGLPVCSTTGPGSPNGAVFNGPGGYLYVKPDCASSNASMYVWMEVELSVSSSTIDHYIWTIRDWTGAAPDGMFTPDTYDELLDTNGVFKVKTMANQIRYMSAEAGDLWALTSLFNQMIDVTAVTKDGQMASGYISLKLHNGMAVGDSLVFGTLTSTDDTSQTLPGSYVDYYSIVGSGTSNALDLEGDFDTFMVLYSSNLTGIATNDDVIPGLDLNSRISTNLASGETYFVEATSASNSVMGNYSLMTSTGTLTPAANPFIAAGSCENIAGDYSVNELWVIDLTFDGQSYRFTNTITGTATITQPAGSCDFTYQVMDPSGVIPPATRLGRVEHSSLMLYSEAYIPQCPEIFINSSTLSGSGLYSGSFMDLNSSGSVVGTFLGVPFSITYSSRATYSR